MSIPLKELEAAALELPIRERAYLAHRLIVSLDEDQTDDPVEVERAWDQEVQRRLEEYYDGTVEPIPADEVLAELRARPR